MNSDSWVAQSTIAKHIVTINETNHYSHLSNEIHLKYSNPYMKSLMY